MSQTINADRLFDLRHKRSLDDLWPILEKLYGERQDYEAFCDALLAELQESWNLRSSELKMNDLERDLEPDWFQRSDMVGYACYIDRFSDNIIGIEPKLDYLQDLGVKYLHLMPCLKPRPRPHDGGYSVQDYRQINPELGTMAELEALAGKLRDRGVSLCIDLVLNHTAKEHEWAQKAVAGDPFYQEFYHLFDNYEETQEFEKTLVEIFPNDSPGNFTYSPELQKWVWTTFNDHQWDLNWANPWVFLEITKVMLFLANKGVDVLRLDAVAFMWKRMGTRCQSEPEVHLLLRALRACSRISSSAVIHLEEAITGPAEMLTYLGRGEHDGREGNLAYHNNLMVQYWSSLATRDTTLMRHVLSENFPEVLTNATYATYLRCHDDIGWAITDEDAGALGISGQMHRSYLSDFYHGVFPGSFSKGELFQVNQETGDKRISGSLASLAGVEKALEENDAAALDQAIHRILMGTALMASFGGLPLIFMGDEIALLNDHSYRDDPLRNSDSRWVHRPKMDWARAQAASENPDTAEGRILAGTRHIMQRRAEVHRLHGGVPTRIMFPEAPEVFGFKRLAPAGPLICLFNFSERTIPISGEWLRAEGVQEMTDWLSCGEISLHDDHFMLLPYGRVWLS